MVKLFTNEKETKRAIKAAVDQTKKFPAHYKGKKKEKKTFEKYDDTFERYESYHEYNKIHGDPYKIIYSPYGNKT